MFLKPGVPVWAAAEGMGRINVGFNSSGCLLKHFQLLVVAPNNCVSFILIDLFQ